MPQVNPDGSIMVLLDMETFKRLEEYAKENGLTTYGDAVKKLVEEVR